MEIPAFYTSRPIPLEEQESDADFLVRIFGIVGIGVFSAALVVAALAAIFW